MFDVKKEVIFEGKLAICLEIEPGYEDFFPEDFKKDPFDYFDSFGKNIKSGDVKFDDLGEVREDPSAVKSFPEWRSSFGNGIFVVGKRVNMRKGLVRETGNPFYEYDIMKLVNQHGLPVSKPIAKISQGDKFLFLMERIEGMSVYEIKKLRLDEDVLEKLRDQAEFLMLELKERFDRIGISRSWKLSDMILDIDSEMNIRSIVPTDWERTRIVVQS